MSTSDSPNHSAAPGGPSFPRRKAFVVQFTAEAGPRSGLFHGRVEHVASGDQTLFRSPDELWGFVRSLMTEPAEQDPAQWPTGGER